MKANEIKAQSANVNNNNVNNNESNASNNVAAEPKAEPAQKPILIDEKKASDTYKVKHAKEINERYICDNPKGEEVPAGTLLAVYRTPKDNKKNGDKTFYKIEFNGVVFDGYSSTEFADANGIERRRYSKKNGENKAQSDNSTIIALRALKESIEKLNKIEKYKTMFAAVKVEDVEKAINEERGTQEAINAFVAKESDKIELSNNYTEESTLIEDLGKLFVNQLKEYGLGFYAPKESTEESNQQTEQTEQTEESK